MMSERFAQLLTDAIADVVDALEEAFDGKVEVIRPAEVH